MKSFLFVVVFISSGIVFSQDANRVINFTDNDGLPQNKIKKILKDNSDYIWIGTQNGVAKFNGYSFKTYKELSGNEVIEMFLTSNNGLWIGTHRGLYELDRKKDKFEKVSLGDIRDIHSIDNHIYFITPDHLFKYEDGSITKFNIPFKNLRQLEINDGVFHIGLGMDAGVISGTIINEDLIIEKTEIVGEIITSLKVINDTLWSGTNDGKVFYQVNGNFQELPMNNQYSIKDFDFQNDQLWIATDGNGLYSYNLKQKSLRHYSYSPNKIGTIESNNIQALLSTNNNDLWVGTYDAGLFYLSFKPTLFDDLSSRSIDEKFNLNQSATSCHENSRGVIYLGTQNGFIRLNENSDPVSRGYDWCQNYLGGSKILAIQEGMNGDVWIGSYDGGIGRLSNDLSFKSSYFPFTQNQRKAQNINAILPYKEGYLLVNSMYNSVAILNEKTESFTKIPIFSSDTITQYQTQALRQQRGETFAYMMRGDLCRLDPHTQAFVPIFTPPFLINDFVKNDDNTFWLATRGEGLILTDSIGNTLKKLTVEDGLSSNFLLRIERDKTNNLLISSISGLTKLSPNGEIQTYDNRHGLPSKEFTPFVSTTLKDGELLFGTVRGFVKTNFKKELSHLNRPVVRFSDLTFQNKSVKELFPDLLPSPIEELKSIELPFDQNSFTLHFFNSDYDLPKFSTFSYRMKGLEDDWISLNENTQTTYTNLLPGKYQFQVKSSNKYGVYSEQPTTLDITILSPWYLTNWAFIIYGLVTILIFYFIFRIILYRAHLKKELEFSSYKVEAMKELNEKKLRFFTNITHDFKTPLTLISAPLENLSKEQNLSASMQKNIDLIKRNADRLHHLIIDLLDFRKTSSSDKLNLSVSETDMDRFLEDLYEPFKSAADLKNIILSVSNTCFEPVFLDNEKIKRIMWNLLSNALKYTPSGGEIQLKCEVIEATGYLSLTVVDSGPGLSNEEIEHMFDRYYQSKVDSDWTEQSFGLGMAIVKGLVTSHRGEIQVNSTTEGSAFNVVIPSQKSHYQPEELIDKPRGNYQFIPPQLTQLDRGTESAKPSKYNLSTILIAEDNIELNEFLVSIFSQEFKVISCYDGQQALKLAQSKSPDLVISDVMMPQMDGYEFCEKIKTNINTSHIPIILLTANSSLEQQVEGMKNGADVYITKPFKTEFLIASVKSILQNRAKLRDKFQQLEKGPESLNGLTETDQKFMQQLHNQMEQNLANPDLSIEDLASEMTCSKSSLIRKVKALTGLTPMAFLRSYRLNKAHELLAVGGLTVSETSYKTGFSDPNYFATSFKKHFGKNPSKINE